jgi:phenylacetaldehyde dehydrogenase
MVVMDDADLDIAIPGTAMGIFANHGQNCCAGSRLFVHERIYDRVTEGIAEIARKIRLGPPLDPATEMGPLISAGQQARVLAYIASGRKEGAEVLVGGAAPAASGSYVQPTVLTHVKPTMRVVREEIFGPVLTAASFSDVGDVLRRANDTQFGLGASIWTRSLDVAHAFIREFKAGTVWVNTHNVLDLAVPFGGVRQSGIGHELGEAAIEHHTHLKAAILPMRDLQ